MVQRRPEADGKARVLESLWDVSGEARLEVYHVTHGVKPWPLHGIPSAQAFVENTGENLDEGAPKPRSARRARGES